MNSKKVLLVVLTLIVAGVIAVLGLNLMAGEKKITQHVDPDPAFGALRQRIGERFADFARPVDIGFERDRRAGAADRSQHRREYLVSVEQRFDAVAGHERRS